MPRASSKPRARVWKSSSFVASKKPLQLEGAFSFDTVLLHQREHFTHDGLTLVVTHLIDQRA